MITEQQLSTVIGSTAHGADGKLGTVGEVYLDDETGRPEWATVRTGMFGTKESFVPLAEADLSGSDLRLPYDKDKIKNAPQIDTDGHLSPTEEAELYRYYGIGSGTETSFADTTTTNTTDTADRTNTHGTVGHDTSGPTTDNAMTRSEEQLRVGTERVEAGRARLRKYVVSENVTQTVPVSHEEIRVEREPITDANVGNALDGPAISEEEHEVVLHAERPVVAKEAVPVERVRLDTQTVTEQETVNEQVRKEQIEFEDGTTTRRSSTAPPPPRDGPAVRSLSGDTPLMSTHDPIAGDGRTPGASATRGTARDAVDAQHNRYGGIKWGAAFFGWLSANGLAVILVALISAGGLAIGLTEGIDNADDAADQADTIGIAGGIVLLVVLFLAYLAGGYVAGRMARFDGVRQGIAVWVIGLLIVIALAVAGLVFGSKYNVLQQLDLPRIPIDEGTATTGGIIALVAVLLVTLLGAILGGKLGDRFHRKVDRAGFDAV